jgi:hypothetical protein
MSTLLVRKDGSGTHTAIQSAIFDAVDGDIVDIGSGLWLENIELYKSITLQGAGKDQTTIQGKLASDSVTGCSFYAGEDIVTVPSSGSFIRGRRVTGSNLTANSRVSEIISETQIKLSLATAATGVVSKVITSLVSDSLTFVAPNVTGLAVGMKVVGGGVLATITAINATTKVVTLSAAVSQSGSSVTLTFRPLRSNVTITMPAQFSGSTFAATMQVMNVATNGLVIKNLKAVGFDGNTSAEAAALSLSSPSTGSHENWLLDNCHFVADGDQAIASSSNLKSINGTIQNSEFSGKTFIGDEPAELPSFSSFSRSGKIVEVTPTTHKVEFSSLLGVIVGSTATSPSHAATATITAISGNVVTFNKTSSAAVDADVAYLFTNVQFIVPNAARQLVVIGNSSSVSACVNTTFKGNVVNGQTGAVISSSGNRSMFNTAVTIDTVGGLIEDNLIDGTFGAGGENTLFSNFAIRSRRPDGAAQQTIIRNNTNDQRDGRKNSGFFFSGDSVVASNNVALNDAAVATLSQPVAGQPVSIEMDLEKLLLFPKVSSSSTFNDESEWELVSFIFKKQGSAKRLVSSFRDFDSTKAMKLRPGMLTGDVFELHKIIISKPDRSLLVLKRADIEGASSMDFTLA